MWKSTHELLADIKQAHARLVEGKTTVEQANAEARLFKSATSVISTTLKHAELSGRIGPKSDALPDMKLPAA